MLYFGKFSKTLAVLSALILVFSLVAFAKEYEGPVPKEFGQAPELAKLVEEGKLPPVEERLPKPEDLYVVEPNEKIGKYGGTLRTTTLSPEGYGDDTLFSAFVNPVKPTPFGGQVTPHVAKKLESSEDKTTWTMYLRRGMRWSDGDDFNADDVMFWYEDMLLNKELTPVIGAHWKAGGQVVEVEKLDPYTVRFKFAKPKPYFAPFLTHTGAWNLFMPKHYLEQFHPNYVSKEELVKEAKEAGFDHWYQYFNHKNNNVWGLPLNTERPTLSGYVLVKRTSDRRIYERNPYFWKVDPEGNQLPYIDKIETTIVTNMEVAQGMIVSGEIDFASMQADVRNYPMYKKYETKGGYKTILWTSGQGNEALYELNLTHEDPVLREIFQDFRFRKALSLAINREEINNAVYFGKAEPRQYTVLPSSDYYEPQFATAYTEYDPEQARSLLDEMGLTDTDGDGWRERSDGKKLTFTLEYFEHATPKQPNVELVTQHWQEVGVDAQAKAISGELQGQRAPANMMDATVWNGDKATDMLFPINPCFFVPDQPRWTTSICPLWALWFQTEGKEGEEPPDNEVGNKMKDLHRWWEQMLEEPDKEKRIELGKNVLRSQAENLWTIGTVGQAPYPQIVAEDLGNYPKEGLWAWDTLWSMTRDPSQFFFEHPENH